MHFRTLYSVSYAHSPSLRHRHSPTLRHRHSPSLRNRHSPSLRHRHSPSLRHRHSPTYPTVAFRTARRGSNFMKFVSVARAWPTVYVHTTESTRTWPSVYVYTTESSWNPNNNTPDPDRPQHDRPAACVIAQQYSSAYFIHCAFIVARTISACVWRMSLFHFVAFFLNNCVSLQLNTSESVCSEVN